MEKKTGTSVANSAHGKPLSSYKDKDGNPLVPSGSITYDWEADQYQTNDELVAAKDEMTLDEQRKSRNADRVNNARTKALTVQLDKLGIIKPDIKNDDQLRLKKMVEVIMSSGRFDEATARQVAANTLGLEWDAE